MAEVNDWNKQIIDEFRANGGQVGGQFEGAPLLLLHTNGAKTGQARVNPVMYQADGETKVVFASKAGAPTNPDWYHNLVANPRASIEVGDKTVNVVAHVADLIGVPATSECILNAVLHHRARHAVVRR